MDLIVRMEFGSKVGGYDVPESDTDYKGISIPNARDILLQRAFRSINKSTGDEDDVIEDVTAKTLGTLISNIDNLVVLFCKLHLKSIVN